MIKFLICFLIAIIGLLIIWIINIYNKFQYNLIKLEKSETNITNALGRKYQVLVRYIEFLEKNIKLEENEFQDFLETNLKGINNIKLNIKIDDCYNQIKGYLDDNQKKLSKETINEFTKEIRELDVIINGCKRYYNNILVGYNKLVKCFPTKYIAKVYKYKERDFYPEDKQDSFKILDE